MTPSLVEIFGRLAPFLLHVIEEDRTRVLFSFRFSREYNLGGVSRTGEVYELVLMKQLRGKFTKRARFPNLTQEQLVETFERETGVICR